MAGKLDMVLKSNCDGLELSLCVVEPAGKPRGLVQLAHGMAEHKERSCPLWNSWRIGTLPA